MKRPHCAGTDHVVPIDGTAGHARVVARGCRVDHPSGYFAESDSAECAHGYTWDCGSCPALPEPERPEHFSFRCCDLFREVDHV